MTTTRFALGLLLSLFCMHCTAEGVAVEDDQAEAEETVDTSQSAQTAAAEKGKKKKDQQDYLIVKLEEVLVSN